MSEELIEDIAEGLKPFPESDRKELLDMINNQFKDMEDMKDKYERIIEDDNTSEEERSLYLGRTAKLIQPIMTFTFKIGFFDWNQPSDVIKKELVDAVDKIRSEINEINGVHEITI